MKWTWYHDGFLLVEIAVSVAVLLFFSAAIFSGCVRLKQAQLAFLKRCEALVCVANTVERIKSGYKISEYFVCGSYAIAIKRDSLKTVMGVEVVRVILREQKQGFDSSPILTILTCVLL